VDANLWVVDAVLLPDDIQTLLPSKAMQSTNGTNATLGASTGR
jgi:hypothetical protein